MKFDWLIGLINLPLLLSLYNEGVHLFLFCHANNKLIGFIDGYWLPFEYKFSLLFVFRLKIVVSLVEFYV